MPKAAEPTWATTGKVYEAFGERKTLTAWSQDARCTITRQGLYHRVAIGLTVEAALQLGPYRPGRVSVAGKRIGRRKKTATAWGRTLTVVEWAAQPEARASAAVIHTRLSRGYPPEQAISLPAYTHRKSARRLKGVDPRVVTAWGETRTVDEWAADARARVPAATILRRLTTGYSPERAISAGRYEHRTSADFPPSGTGTGAVG